MGDSDEYGTPFWLETTDGLDCCSRYFFNTGVLVIILSAIAFAFIFIVITPFLSFTSDIFRPQEVKKTLDSLILGVVLFVAICALLTSNGGDRTPRSNGVYESSSTPEHADDGGDCCHSLVFDTGFYIIFSLVIGFVFKSVVIPSFLCFTSNVFKNEFVKTMDSLILVILLFAVICGALNIWYGNYRTPASRHDGRSNPSSSGRLYDDRTADGALRRMRSSSSYPDLRRESTWADDRWRFNDDSGLYHRSRSRPEFDEGQVYFSNTPVDTVTHPPPPYQVPAPPPMATRVEPTAPPAPDFLLSPSAHWTYEQWRMHAAS